MKTFDLAEVRHFTANLDTGMEECVNGEGMECSTLDATLDFYALTCCKFCAEVRAWGRAVFAGKVAFDPEVEQLWQSEGFSLFQRASEMLDFGRKAEVPCYIIESQEKLRYAIAELVQLISRWVSPHPAVGPSARVGLAGSAELRMEVEKRLTRLPALPTDWQPEDLRQRSRFRKRRSG